MWEYVNTIYVLIAVFIKRQQIFKYMFLQKYFVVKHLVFKTVHKCMVNKHVEYEN